MANDKIIWDYLYDKIGNAYGVAGLMGNLYAESGLIPTNMENAYEKKLGYTDSTYTEAVDNGKYTKFGTDAVGYGLAQWTYHTRKKALLAYAQSKGVSIGDLNMQVEFLYKELSESYKGVLNTLKSSNSVKMASNKVLTDFERPANQSDSVKNLRTKYGQNYYDKYANVIKEVQEEKQQEIKETSTIITSVSGGVKSTMGYSAQKLLDIARAEIGYKEKASNSNLDSMTGNAGSNNWTKYARDLAAAGYYNGNKNGYAWCDVFVDWCFYQLAGKNAKVAQDLICQTGDLGAAVNYSANYYKQQGRFYTSNPQPGDQIFFKSGSSIVHTGIVESVANGVVQTIEGNSSNMVRRCSYSTSNSQIYGYGRPKYNEESTFTTDDDGYTSTVAKPSVVVSDSGDADNIKDGIKSFQKWLNSSFGAGLSVDGEYGSKTKKAAVSALQRILNSLYKTNLQIDGSYGTLTKAAVKSYINLKKGSRGNSVYILQGLLYCKGYNPTGLDGQFGSGTDKAVRSFQQKKSLTVDGEAGPNTFNALLS